MKLVNDCGILAIVDDGYAAHEPYDLHSQFVTVSRNEQNALLCELDQLRREIAAVRELLSRVDVPVAQPVSTTELRPPPEHAEKTWHWIDGGCENPRSADELGSGRFVLEWCASEVAWWVRGGFVRPHAAALRGWRYLGPAEWLPEPPVERGVVDKELFGVVCAERDEAQADLLVALKVDRGTACSGRGAFPANALRHSR